MKKTGLFAFYRRIRDKSRHFRGGLQPIATYCKRGADHARAADFGGHVGAGGGDGDVPGLREARSGPSDLPELPGLDDALREPPDLVLLPAVRGAKRDLIVSTP